LTDGYSVRELLLLAQNHIPPSQTALRDNIARWLASYPAEIVERWRQPGAIISQHEIDALIAQNAELVAALKESLALNENFVGVSEDETLAHLSEHKAVIAQARAALAAAGQSQGSGE
jgi:hypothetical protein